MARIKTVITERAIAEKKAAEAQYALTNSYTS
jgi:hypothetical protein